jgi:hypothetical protein
MPLDLTDLILDIDLEADPEATGHVTATDDDWLAALIAGWIPIPDEEG